MSRALALVLVATALTSGTVAAQDASDPPPEAVAEPPPEGADPLALAEQAYLDVDFETIQLHGEDALAGGRLTPQQLVRVYQLLGIAAVALGDSEAAHRYFVVMLAIDPAARLPSTVPPRLRGPYMEARGEVSARSQQLTAEVGLAHAEGGVRVVVTDPFELVRRLRVHARVEGAAEYETTEREVQGEVLVPVAGGSSAERVECWVELVDQFGNRVLQLGDAIEPRVLFGRAEVSATTGPTPGGNVLEEPAFWIGALGALVVAGAVTTGVLVDQASHRPSVVTSVSIGF